MLSLSMSAGAGESMNFWIMSKPFPGKKFSSSLLSLILLRNILTHNYVFRNIMG